MLFPPGTPADEELLVRARGDDGESGGPTARVSPDGAFRAELPGDATSGPFQLVARYLWLPPEPAGWSKGWWVEDDGSVPPVVLEPVLGARIVGRLVPPSGADLEHLRGRARLFLVDRDGSSPAPLGDTASDGLAFCFDAIEAREDERVAVDFEGDGFLGTTGPIELVAGRTQAVEVPLEQAVLLAGTVRDESGKPLWGIRVDATSNRASNELAHRSQTETRSTADGSFRLESLRAGHVVLRGERGDGSGPSVERDLGELAPGAIVVGLELVLERGESIAGHVRWPDGRPARAKLFIAPRRVRLDEWPRAAPPAVWSDTSGAFRIEGLFGESYSVLARAAVEGAVPAHALDDTRSAPADLLWSAEAPAVDAGTQELELVLSAGLELVGRVVDDLGTPLARGSVSVARPGFPGSRPEDTLTRPIASGDGSFSLSGLTAGEWEVQATAPGHAPSELRRVALPGSAPVMLVVPRTATVTGRVLDPRSAGLEGAFLATSQEEPRSGRESLDVRSGEDGAFRLSGLAPGRVVLWAWETHTAPSDPVVLELAPGEALDGVELRLQASGTILGELFASDGTPSPGNVWASSTRFERGCDVEDDGRFELHGVPAGDVHLEAWNAEGMNLVQTVTLEEGQTVRVRLAPGERGVRLHGHVRAGDEPLAQAEVWAGRLDEPGTSVGETDAEGAYEIHLSGPGRTMLHFEGTSTLQTGWSVPVDVPDVAAWSYDVEIPLGYVSGTVTDKEGHALTGIVVSSEPEQHENQGHGAARTLTDDEGHYELVLPPGRHAVCAGGTRGSDRTSATSGWSEARIGGLVLAESEHLRGIDLVLTKGGTLEGFALRAGGLPLGEPVELWAEEGARPRSLGRTDASGRFRLEGLTPGRIVLGARGPALATPEQLELTIVAGETEKVELTLAPARFLHLTVLQRGARVGSDLTVFDARGRPQPIPRQDLGELWVGPLVPGSYRVQAWRDGQTLEQDVEVAAGGPEPALELVFQ